MSSLFESPQKPQCGFCPMLDTYIMELRSPTALDSIWHYSLFKTKLYTEHRLNSAHLHFNPFSIQSKHRDGWWHTVDLERKWIWKGERKKSYGRWFSKENEQKQPSQFKFIIFYNIERCASNAWTLSDERQETPFIFSSSWQIERNWRIIQEISNSHNLIFTLIIELTPLISLFGAFI